MTERSFLVGTWFVYDGDCPLCRNAALALRLRQSLGGLTLLDARDSLHHPLMAEITARGLDLDEGMVIYHKGAFLHGQEALHFMAIHGSEKGLFNRFNRLMFRSPKLARRLYPALRTVRNMLLTVLGKTKISNLTGREEPTFKPVFGDAWDQLPLEMLKHYKNRPYSADANRIHGTMSIRTHPFLRPFAPLSRLGGAVPLTNARNVPVTVDFESEPTSPAFHFNRLFHLGDKAPYRFHSRMLPRGENRMAEIMKCRLCWCVRFRFDGSHVRLDHEGYALYLFGRFLPLPINWLLGRVTAKEWVTGTDRFDMQVNVIHPLLGDIYEYKGSFSTDQIDA